MARDAFLANALILPGLGSIIGGRRAGWVQAALAVAGFILTNVWAVSFAAEWFGTREFPWNGGPHFRMGLIGIALFIVAWTWALATSWIILRQSRRSKPPL
jgi:hypothetical protein